MDLINAWKQWAKRMEGAGWRQWDKDGAVWLHCDEWIGLRSVTAWQMFLRDEIPNPYQLATVEELTKLPRECILHVV